MVDHCELHTSHDDDRFGLRHDCEYAGQCLGDQLQGGITRVFGHDYPGKNRKKRDLRLIRTKQPLWFGHREERVGGDGPAGQWPTTGFLEGMTLLGTFEDDLSLF